jgi:integrase
MRVGEAKNLRWGDIDLCAQRPSANGEMVSRVVIRILGNYDESGKRRVGGKTGKRTITAPDQLRAVFEKMRKMHGDTPPTADELVWKVTEYHHLFGRILHKLSMTHDAEGNALTLYSLRHTFITDQLRRPGSNAPEIADYCGTSLIQLNNHYSHVLAEMRSERYAAITVPGLDD